MKSAENTKEDPGDIEPAGDGDTQKEYFFDSITSQSNKTLLYFLSDPQHSGAICHKYKTINSAFPK